MKVLIIEDDPSVSYFLEHVVASAGHETRVASDGELGVRLFDQFEPDLVISDYKLPRMDGLQVLAEVRKRNLDVIFIVITGYGSEEFAIQALRLRANNYLQKPIRHESLVNLLQKYEELVRSRSLREEVRRMVVRRDFVLELDNRLDAVSEVVNYLVSEAEPWLSAEDRFGVQLGLYELLMNAIEHGNLEISYEQKNLALYDSPARFLDLVKQRLADREMAERRVRVEFRMGDGQMEWLISDQGKGFDWYSLPNPLSQENQENLNGRGVFLAKFQFDEVSYLGSGNRVRVMKKMRLARGRDSSGEVSSAGAVSI